MQQWTVVIDWADGDVEDSDECSVYAASSDEAISMAREIWQRTYGSQWPSCEIVTTTALAHKSAPQTRGARAKLGGLRASQKGRYFSPAWKCWGQPAVSGGMDLPRWPPLIG
jgi:hypothetical protein